MKAICSAVLTASLLLPALPSSAQPDKSSSATTLQLWPTGYLARKTNQPARAVRLVRAYAQEWNIDADRIGIMGFSAGGDLAARVSTNFETPDYTPIDKFDQISCRPDFTILIYPAYLAADPNSASLATELHVSHETPPAFVVQAEDDPIGVMNSIYYYSALARYKVPAEMHIYAFGGHGYGLRPSSNNISTWPSRLKDWLQSIGMLAR